MSHLPKSEREGKLGHRLRCQSSPFSLMINFKLSNLSLKKQKLNQQTQMGHSLTCHLNFCNSLYLKRIPDTDSAVHDGFFLIEHKPSELSTLIGEDLGCHLSIIVSRDFPVASFPFSTLGKLLLGAFQQIKNKIPTHQKPKSNHRRGKLLFWHVLADHNRKYLKSIIILKHPPLHVRLRDHSHAKSHLFTVDALQFPIHGTSHVISLDPTTHLSRSQLEPVTKSFG